MKKIVFFILMISSQIYGAISVIDGDTIRINKARIRLEGIDAPELDQKCFNSDKIEYNCGGVSRDILKSLVNDKTYCLVNDQDRYKRVIGTCYTAGVNINQKMVRLGQAVVYTTYSTKYQREQDIAKRKRIGIWTGHFDYPWDYRRAKYTGLR